MSLSFFKSCYIVITFNIGVPNVLELCKTALGDGHN